MTGSQMALDRMRAEIAAGSPLLKEQLRLGGDRHVPPAGFSDLFTAACGDSLLPGGAGIPGDDAIPGAVHYCFALEYIFEGYLLHYGQSRLLSPGSRDFNLLAGDYMYAKGLDRISRLEDPVCIKLFAGLVSLCSFVYCEKLSPGVALRAWAGTALCLAAHASGSGETCRHELDELKKNVWRQRDADAGKDGPKTLDGAFEDLLTGYSPAAGGVLRSILSDIYSHHAL